MNSPPQIHQLTFPLRIETDQPNHYFLLPMGTTLYYSDSYPEGFDRYYIYVNVEGVNLPLSPLEKPGLVDPLTAYPISKEEIGDLAKDYPISKEHLTAILGATSLTKEDLIDIANQLPSKKPAN